MKYKVSLGIDLGTSKISGAYFCETTKDWDLILVSTNKESLTPDRYRDYVESSKVAISTGEGEAPLFGREVEPKVSDPNIVILESIKKCVFCEWFVQMANRSINQEACVNYKNYNNRFWCQSGRLNFLIGQYEWKPEALFQQLTAYMLEKVKEGLNVTFKENYLITELKLAFPMIFYKGGPSYEQRLASMVKGIANTVMKGKIDNSRFDVFVVEEPVASLMAHWTDDVTKIPLGDFMIVDIGAGTTDIAVCERTPKGIGIINHDSFILAGDNYDEVTEALIKSKAGGDGAVITDSKGEKENYCKSSGNMRASYRFAGESTIRTVEIPREEIEKGFEGLNETLILRIKGMREKLQEKGKDLRKIYLTGGGSNVLSLKSRIEAYAKEEREIPVEIMSIKDSPAAIRYDARIVGASMGAALPRSQYIDILKYVLPVSLMVKYTSQNGDVRECKIYEAHKGEAEECHKIEKVKPDSKMRLLVEDSKGNREVLNSFSIPGISQKEKEKRKGKTDLAVKIQLDVEFNGKTKITCQIGKRQKIDTIYNSFPHWKLRR
jgi:molecular chaperone DnaK (HSP70)